MNELFQAFGEKLFDWLWNDIISYLENSKHKSVFSSNESVVEYLIEDKFFNFIQICV